METSRSNSLQVRVLASASQARGFGQVTDPLWKDGLGPCWSVMDSRHSPLTRGLGSVWGFPVGIRFPQRQDPVREAVITEGRPPTQLLPLLLEADLKSDFPCWYSPCNLGGSSELAQEREFGQSGHVDVGNETTIFPYCCYISPNAGETRF